MQAVPDQDLVLRFVHGRDGPAFAAIVERYRSALFSVAYSMVGNVHDADDAVQDAFVAAYADMPRLRRASALGPWLRRIVEHKAKQHLRRGRSRQRALAKLTMTQALPDQEPDHAGLEHADRVWRALADLTYNERVVTVLRCIDGLRHREIAGFLGVTEGSVRKRLHDARRKLRSWFQAPVRSPAYPPADTKRLAKKVMAQGEELMTKRTPSVYEKTPTGPEDSVRVVQYDLIDRLLRDSVVWLSGRIDEDLSVNVTSQIMFLGQEKRDQAISLYITSGGGDLMSGLAMYDTMQWVTSPVQTFGIGAVAGIATLLVAAGEPGLRRALPNAGFMLMEPERPEDYEIKELYEERAIVKFRARFLEILAKHTGRQRSKVERDAKNAIFLTAEEAKSYGIVDEILAPHGGTGR